MANTVSHERDEVLYSFHRACPVPTAADVVAWAARYPEYADEIRAHASVALDWAARGELEEEVDESALSRAHSRALNVIYSSRVVDPAQAQSDEPAVGFFVRMDKSGTKVSRLASEIGIGRAVLADLFNGWMRPPVGRRLARALMTVFDLDRPTFDREVDFALAHPRMGEAKASGPPRIVPRSYDECVRSSGMEPHRIHYWLEED